MKRNAFTLVELLIVIAIIAIVAGMATAALMGASEEGRRMRARSQVAKLDQLISEKWRGYRFRQLPIRIPSGTLYIDSDGLAKRADFGYAYANRMRLDVMRELMRMEMPDRLSDVTDDPVSPQPGIHDPNYIARGGAVVPPQPIPSALRAYRRKVTPQAASSLQYDQAEMLYLIVSEIRDGDKSALEYFSASEIGDLDGDGMYEILDPWGQPIMFLRWAPGYSSVLASDLPPNALTPPAPQPAVVVSTFQIPDGNAKPDTYDPLKADPRWNINAGFRPFQTRPLIFSGGSDKVYDIYTDDADPATKIRYSQTAPANDPYVVKIANGANVWVGTPADYDGDGLQHGDNITNHGLELEGE